MFTIVKNLISIINNPKLNTNTMQSDKFLKYLA